MGANTELRERRERPAERLLDNTLNRKNNLAFEIVRRKSYGRGYWLGFGSATTCSLIWVVLDLLTTGRLPWLTGG